MNLFAEQSLFFGMAISILAYGIGLVISGVFKIPLVNPLMIAVVIVIAFLKITGVNYETYNASAKYLSFFLTPATVCLAIPLYSQLSLLKRHAKAIILSVLAGVVTSLLYILVLSMLFGITHSEYVSLLPKSITTAIGIEVSKELGGIIPLTVSSIVATGIIGNMLAQTVCKIFRITNPIAKGLAIGTSAHAIGTAKAVELGEIEGAMSSLAIVVSGIFTVLIVSVFASLY